MTDFYVMWTLYPLEFIDTTKGKSLKNCGKPMMIMVKLSGKKKNQFVHENFKQVYAVLCALAHLSSSDP